MTTTTRITEEVARFDPDMYQAALAYSGLPANYTRVFRETIQIDKTTGEPLLDKNGKPKTTLYSCQAAKESQAGCAVWVQVNQPRDGTALTGDETSKKRYPKKAKNEEIGTLANITLDCEYPQDPPRAHAVGLALNDYLIAQGLVSDDHPVEDSGAGLHLVLPIPPITLEMPEEAPRWNAAVHAVVEAYIRPAFVCLCEEHGIEMDLDGYDISRLLSVPGTWRPHTPKKPDCDLLKAGYPLTPMGTILNVTKAHTFETCCTRLMPMQKKRQS